MFFLVYRSLKLFVANFDKSVDEHMLKTYFEKFGPVEHANIPIKARESAKRYGFVVMGSQQAFDAVLRQKRIRLTSTNRATSRCTRTTKPSAELRVKPP